MHIFEGPTSILFQFGLRSITDSEYNLSCTVSQYACTFKHYWISDAVRKVQVNKPGNTMKVYTLSITMERHTCLLAGNSNGWVVLKATIAVSRLNGAREPRLE